MKKIINYLVFGLFTLICNTNVFGHSTQVAYCYDCDGNLTIYIDTWHGTNSGDSYDYTLTINGVATNYTNATPNGTNPPTPGVNANGIIGNTTLGNLPNCQGARVLVGQCQTDNDWKVFYHGAVPRGVPIKIQITSGNGLDAELNCNDLSRIATFYIPIAPIAAGGGNFCLNQTPVLWAHTTQFTNTIYEQNGTTLVSSTKSDTTHTIQWQEATAPGGPWTNIGGGPGQSLHLGPLQVIGTKYYQAIYLSAATTQVIPAHDENVADVHCPNAAGTADSLCVVAHVVTIPTTTVYISSGGCPLTSNIVAVGTFLGPTAQAGTDTTVCSSPALKQMGTATTAGWVYSWSPTTGLSNPNIANPTASLSTPGTNTYVVTTRNPSCPVTARDTAVIKVNPIPTATVTGTTTVCKNAASPNITFTGANGTVPYTFTYTLNGANNTVSTTGGSSSVTVPAPTGTLGAFTYALVSVKESSSTACSQAQANSAVVTITALPTATISGTVTKCLNDPSPDITFTGVGTAPFTFTYTLNGGSNLTVTSAGNSATIPALTTTAGTYTFTLVSVQDAACSQNQTGTAVVTVNPLGGTVTGSTAVCQNSAAPNVTFTGGGGLAPYTFAYTLNGTNQTISTTGGSNSVILSAPTGTLGSFVYAVTSVEDANSLSCLSASSITVTVGPLPTATISGATTICQNTPPPNITFTGTGTAPYIFTYTLNGANKTVSTTGISNTVNVAAPTTVAGAFTYSLVSVQDASCSQNQSGGAVVTVNPAPTAVISGATAICNGDPAPNITFTGSTGTTPYTFTYTLNGANQTVSTTGGSSSVMVVAPTTTSGTFTYSLTGVQDANASACGFASGSAVVTVNPLPTAMMGGTATVCLNAPPPNITFTGAAGTAPYTFTYTLNGANKTVSTTGGSSSVIVATPTAVAGTFTYSLVSVQDASCSQNQSGGAIVTVIPAPAASISGAATVCNGDPAPNITFTGSNGTPPYTFTYTLNGANKTVSTTGGSSSAMVAAPTTTSGPFTYSLTGVQDVNLSACGFASGIEVITVNPLPTATMSGTVPKCLNDPPPNITFTGATGTPPYTFTYTLNGANKTVSTTGGSNSAIVVAPTVVAGTFTYSLVSVQDANCSQTQADNAVVTVNPPPVVTVNSPSICPRQPTTLTASGALSYVWQNGSVANPLPVAPSITTSYIITGTDANGCSSTGLGTVTVFPHPQAQFNTRPNPAGIFNPVVNFTNNSTPDVNSWFWSFGDGDSLTTNSSSPPTHTYSGDTATYTATLIVHNPGFCYDTMRHVIQIVPEYGFYIPDAFSPNDDGINDVFFGKGTAILDYQLSVFDRWGNFIFYSSDINKGWDGRASLGSEVAQQDVYVWQVALTDIFKKKHNYIGTVTIVK